MLYKLILTANAKYSGAFVFVCGADYLFRLHFNVIRGSVVKFRTLT